MFNEAPYFSETPVIVIVTVTAALAANLIEDVEKAVVIDESPAMLYKLRVIALGPELVMVAGTFKESPTTI